MLYDLWDRYRTWIIVIGISLFVCLSFWFYPGATEYGPAPPFPTAVYASGDQLTSPTAQSDLLDKSSSPISPDTSQPATTNTNMTKPNEKEQPAKLQYIDIKGAVKRPGVYSFEPNERIHDLIQKAGGLLPSADQNRINLAQSLVDGMMIWIPAKTEPASPSPASPAVNTGGSITNTNTNTTPIQLPQTVASSGVVNINSASVEQLMTLPGIGETRAKAIISYRESKGGFRSIQQLREIQGIGEKSLEKIKDKVSLQ